MAQKIQRKGDSGQFNLPRSKETSKELVKYRYMTLALAISNCIKYIYTWVLAHENDYLGVYPAHGGRLPGRLQ